MFSTFTAIFEALSEIEAELAGDASEAKRKQITEALLSLRKTMDKCVQYWLQFEERVNELQERYALSLPDTLPPGFLEDIDLEGETAVKKPLPLKQAAKESPDKDDAGTADVFAKPASEITVNSFRRALGFWELAMLREAVAEFKKVVEEEPNLTVGHFCLGLSSAQLGKVEEAFRELKLVLALDKNEFLRALALNTLGIILAGKEDYLQAQHYFRRAAEADPNLCEAWFNLGAAAYNLQDYAAAAEAFQKARELSSGDWEIDLYLGRALGYQGRYREALQVLERACRANPREPLITFELGLLCRLLGKKGRAQRYFHTTLSLLKAKC